MIPQDPQRWKTRRWTAIMNIQCFIQYCIQYELCKMFQRVHLAITDSDSNRLSLAIFPSENNKQTNTIVGTCNHFQTRQLFVPFDLVNETTINSGFIIYMVIAGVDYVTDLKFIKTQ